MIDRESYRQGFEDALETVKLIMEEKKLMTSEIRATLIYILDVVREDKINRLRRELGII